MARLILLIGLFGALILATSAMSLVPKDSNRRLIQYDSTQENGQEADPSDGQPETQEADQASQDSSSSSSSSEGGPGESDYSATTAETLATSALPEATTPASTPTTASA